MPHITVCICTFRRPVLLRRLLESLGKLKIPDGGFTYSAVVVDNDEAESARQLVEEFGRSSPIPLVYGVEPQRNFALVRNRTLALAQGDFIAFVDDDEVPVPEWLANLLDTQKRHDADGVLGPVRPYFETEPARWIVQGKLCERPAHPTGMTMHWNQCRTGNVLLQRALFVRDGLLFDPAFAKGGEDVDFFKRAIASGHRFVWCEEAPVYELVPPSRLERSYFLKRALLQGQISLGYAADQLTAFAKARIGLQALTALFIYTVALPFLFLGGFHWGMKYLIKWCHHFGRFCALGGIKLIRERNF